MAANAAFNADHLCTALVEALALSDPAPAAPRILDCSPASARIATHLHRATGHPVRTAAPDGLRAVFAPSAFDVVVLCGDAFADLLDHAPNDERPSHAAVCDAYAAVVRIMHAVKQTLAPHGRFYFDLLPTADNGTVSTFSAPGADGANVQCTVAPDTERYSRKLELRVGTAAPVVKHGLLASERQLQAAASYAGFTSMQRLPDIAGHAYRGFVASFESHEPYYDRAAWYRAIWNTSGSMNWGLVPDAYPAPFSDSVQRILDGRTDVGDATGAMVRPNLAIHAFMFERIQRALRGKPVSSVLDVGCGTGRSTLELAKLYGKTVRYVLGVDPGHANIATARSFVASERRDGAEGADVEFFEGTMDALPSTLSSRRFSLAWSESALGHAAEDARKASLTRVYEMLEPGGVFVLNDFLAGWKPMCGGTRLHMFERLQLHNCWNCEQYIGVLRGIGFRLLEWTDLTAHMVASYRLIADATRDAALRAEEGSAQRWMLSCLETDYRVSAEGGDRGDNSWGLFVCTK